MSPITGTFSKPVFHLALSLGGAMSCFGTFGTVTAYNARGTQVEQRDLVNSDQGCDFPEIQGGVSSGAWLDTTLQFPGGIARITITPPQPGEYHVYGGDPDTNHSFVYVVASPGYFEVRPPTVDSCLTGDEMLDQRATRDMLKADWDSSNATDVPVNRRETRGWVFEDSTGNLVYGAYPHRTPGLPPDTLVDGPCNSVGLPPNPEPGIRVARGHTHMFAPVDTIFPPVCGVKTNSGVDMRFGGPSKADIRQVTQDGVPGYILERDTIRVIPLGTDTLNARSKVKRYPRVDPVTGCRRL
jgi:hypothetical protein